MTVTESFETKLAQPQDINRGCAFLNFYSVFITWNLCRNNLDALHYSLTLPSAMPVTKYFCRKG